MIPTFVDGQLGESDLKLILLTDDDGDVFFSAVIVSIPFASSFLNEDTIVFVSVLAIFPALLIH